MAGTTQNEWVAFLIGIFLGAGALVVVTLNFGYTEEAYRLKDECEKDLPRDRVCAMRFVKPK